MDFYSGQKRQTPKGGKQEDWPQLPLQADREMKISSNPRGFLAPFSELQPCEYDLGTKKFEKNKGKVNKKRYIGGIPIFIQTHLTATRDLGLQDQNSKKGPRRSYSLESSQIPRPRSMLGKVRKTKSVSRGASGGGRKREITAARHAHCRKGTCKNLKDKIIPPDGGCVLWPPPCGSSSGGSKGNNKPETQRSKGGIYTLRCEAALLESKKGGGGGQAFAGEQRLDERS